MTSFPIFLDSSPIDPARTLPRVGIGDRVSWYLELEVGMALPPDVHVDVQVTVKRHGRGGGTAVLVAEGTEFAMDGETYPRDGGRLRGVLCELTDEIPHGLAPVTGVVRRIRHRTSTGNSFRLHDVEEVPRGRDADLLITDDLGYVVELEADG